MAEFGTPALSSPTLRRRRSPAAPTPQSGAPRAFDIAVSCAALLFLAPLLLVVAACIALFDRGPILFSHRRIGQDGLSFGCLKFRTMVVDAEDRLAALLERDPVARAEWESTHKLTVDPRITPLGRYLRASSLDELPQLINVIRGDMNLIGPRPIVAAEKKFYGRRLAHYASVRPGISGLWQISGRSDTSFRRRVACDVVYARNRSFALDLKILVMTIPAVLAARGAR